VIEVDSYSVGDRSEVAHFVPPTKRLLDVGCNEGAFGALMAKRGTEVHGIEPNLAAAEIAATRLTSVTVGLFPDDLPDGEPFDCIVFNDVLEHMADPAAALAAAKDHLTDGGTLVASVPNVRHVSVLAPLLLHGRWDYRDWGILDRTHLRFFTKATTRELVESGGFRVERQEPINMSTTGRRRMLRLLGSVGEELLAEQYVIVARST
jgi:2-polyprenyl-3-methyl-5-hydroxy-6-metoxy-1,4-benzoquinol methylase